MKKLNPTEKTFIIVAIAVIGLGLFQTSLNKKLTLLDARVSNIEAAKP